MHKSELDTPVIIVDLDVMENNIRRVKSQNCHQNMREWWHGTDKEMPAMR